MAVAKNGPSSPFESTTFEKDVDITVDDDIGAASISPAGRDVVLASKSGLRIIDLDSPYSLPLFIENKSSWDVADVQWSPFASRSEWIASTQNQNALVYNLNMPYSQNKPPIQFKLRAHSRAITDINFSAHHPELLATCGVDSFVFIHDLRKHRAGDYAAQKLADWKAGATQVKWNRQNDKIIASAHDRYLHIWDIRKGVTPLSTITAHTTKIYGIDWNRTDESKILTCSLDSTIKLWDNVGKILNISTPNHAIVTRYPVWRARHTPFPGGILAMPQRGNSNLWLYKHANEHEAPNYTSQHKHVFSAHEPDAQVREFLWRVRGDTDNGIDNREFQLVSWGTDRHLYLHRLSPELLQRTVGYRKGAPHREKWISTRRGARYLTYTDGPEAHATTKPSTSGVDLAPSQGKGNLSRALDYSRATGQAPPSFVPNLPHRETMSAQPVRRKGHQGSVVSNLAWINGVKFGNRHDSVNNHLPQSATDEQRPSQLDDEQQSHQEQNDLGAEISLVGNKYSKLNFEHIDVPGRNITVSFYGPWGEINQDTGEHKLVFLRFVIRFPATYPKARTIQHLGQALDEPKAKVPSSLDIKFERTTAVLGREMQDMLVENMKNIAYMWSTHERESLEAVLAYALGARSLDASLFLAEDDLPPLELGEVSGESSTEDENEEDGEFHNDIMHSSQTNANIPLPVACTVRFSSHGCLVLARVPSAKNAGFAKGLIAPQLNISTTLRYARGNIFDTFGNFATRNTQNDSDQDSSETSSTGSWESSSSRSSSSISKRINARVGNFRPPLAWQKATSRFDSRHSLPSSTGAAAKPVKKKSVISILASAVDDLVPSKRFLAEEYRIFGPGPLICEHNSSIARKYGLDDLADIWILCKLILNNEVPLEILPQTHRKDQILMLARRALVRIKRKDSGLDLQFDEADTVTNPKLQGRIKWGDHTMVKWLIPALFDHFERLADTQMLAMLSCVFAEPAAREGFTSSMSQMRQSQLPMSMEAPAFSLDYFPSSDAAWSLFRPSFSIPSTPSYSRFATPTNDFDRQRLAKKVDTYGSHGSSNGVWGSDTVNSEPMTPFSTDNTPPNLSRASTTRSAQTAGHTPYGASPEQSHTGLKRSSTTNFATAMAALSRPFATAVSSSPPTKSRIEDLSTSAPTSGVTWGTTTFYGGDSQDRRSLAPSQSKHGKRASFGQSERLDVIYPYDSDSEYERGDDEGFSYRGTAESTAPGTPTAGDADDDVGAIKVTLKNQNQFDDEACVSKPLLDSSKDWLHRAWREQYAEMLSCWGLVSTKAEVLKFNGLVSYFPPELSRANSKAGSISVTVKSEETNELDRHFSKASANLVPAPAVTVSQPSPVALPQGFALNPEAREFQPGTALFTPAEVLATLPEAVIQTEQCLHLSIPVPMPSKELSEEIGGLGASSSHSRLHPPSSRASRPSLSRGTSNASGTSSWRSGSNAHPTNSLPTTTTTTTDISTNTSTTQSQSQSKSQSPPQSSNPVYTCSICWIRVSGRFYLCPACGHVAHFTCMDSSLSPSSSRSHSHSHSLFQPTSSTECIVGCSCGCGIEHPSDERSRMEAYLDGVRAAHAAGLAWSEAGDMQTEWPGTPLGVLSPGVEGAEFVTAGGGGAGGSNAFVVIGSEGRKKKDKDKKNLITAEGAAGSRLNTGISVASVIGSETGTTTTGTTGTIGTSRQSATSSPIPGQEPTTTTNTKRSKKKSKKKKAPRASALSYY